MLRFGLALLVVGAALVSPLAFAVGQPPSPLPRLGRVTFPNSGNAAAQPDFLRGVAWLHSFGYEDAIDAFRAAQKADPSFALAYWGEAMSFSQPLWFFEEVEKCPAVKWRMEGSEQVDELVVAKEFSYLTDRSAGEGWVLVTRLVSAGACAARAGAVAGPGRSSAHPQPKP